MITIISPVGQFSIEGDIIKITNDRNIQNIGIILDRKIVQEYNLYKIFINSQICYYSMYDYHGTALAYSIEEDLYNSNNFTMSVPDKYKKTGIWQKIKDFFLI